MKDANEGLPAGRLREAVREFWNARYASGLVYGTEPTSVAPRIAEAFREAGVRTVLEAGCGSGRDALYYASAGFTVTGLDLSERAIAWVGERARRDGLPISLIAGDLLAADLPNGGYDASVAIHLIHLQARAVRSAMVNRLWQLTREGGLIAVANYSTEEAGFQTWQADPEPNTRIDPRGKLVHFFDEAEIRILFPPDRFDLIVCKQVDLAEIPDTGPVTHREWLTIARKARAW